MTKEFKNNDQVIELQRNMMQENEKLAQHSTSIIKTKIAGCFSTAMEHVTVIQDTSVYAYLFLIA